MTIEEILSKLYIKEEGMSRNPKDDDRLEQKMPKKFRMIFKTLLYLIRLFLVLTSIAVIYILYTGDWSISKNVLWLIMVPNFLFSVFKQQMRIYAKEKYY